MKKRLSVILQLLAVLLFTFPVIGKITAQNESSKVQFRGVAEVGFTSVLAHQIQLGNSGTNFDYVKAGGQDVLFPTFRFQSKWT